MRTFRLFVALLSFVAVQTAGAQRAAPIGFTARAAAPPRLTTAVAALPGDSGTPRWVRWGLVGAVGGAVLFTLANGFNGGAHSTGSEILAGATTGFVIVGGGVLLYDSVCSSGSRSAFCGR